MCIEATKTIINPILKNRYSLPAIEIGVGMSFSQAVITITGTSNFLKPTAFGKCVFYASKLSKGRNEVYADEALKIIWPKTEDGKLRFFEKLMGGVTGYLLHSQ